MRHDNLKDKVVVITGASSGLGRAAALEFARQGSRLRVLRPVPGRTPAVLVGR